MSTTKKKHRGRAPGKSTERFPSNTTSEPMDSTQSLGEDAHAPSVRGSDEGIAPNPAHRGRSWDSSAKEFDDVEHAKDTDRRVTPEDEDLLTDETEDRE